MHQKFHQTFIMIDEMFDAFTSAFNDYDFEEYNIFSVFMQKLSLLRLAYEVTYSRTVTIGLAYTSNQLLYISFIFIIFTFCNCHIGHVNSYEKYSKLWEIFQTCH